MTYLRVLHASPAIGSNVLKGATAARFLQEDAGLLSVLRGLIRSSISGVCLPAKAFWSLTPVASARVLARAVGVLTLALWWAFSVVMGLLPATMAWLGSRYVGIVIMVGCDVITVGHDVIMVGCDVIVVGCDVIIVMCDVIVVGCDVIVVE